VAGTWKRPAAALSLCALALAEVAVGLVGSALVGFDLAAARDSFVLTNSAIALSLAVAGGLVAVNRPANALGWLLLGGAVFQGATAAAAPLLAAGVAAGWPDWLLRTVGTVGAYAWPWTISLFLPLALLVFPTGRLPGPRWRPVPAVVAVVAVLFALDSGALPGGLIGERRVDPWLVIDSYDTLTPLWAVAEVLNGAVYLLALASLVLRYRRGDERDRRQLLWILWALLLVVVGIAIWAPLSRDHGPIVLILFCIPLVPAAMTIAVLRHQLLDIRLVFSRTVLYALLTAAAVGVYLGVVALAGRVLSEGVGSSVIATVLVAIGFNPVRVRLQGIVDRALYGDRADPVRVVSRIGQRLSADADAGGVLAGIREALRLPYAGLRVDGAEQAASGTPPELLETVPLAYGGDRVGELVVGVRSGQRTLDRSDRSALELLAAPLAVAVRATALSDAVQRSRSQIVAAREEERRRLRRDLHDGLGPALTGIAFQADAAGNLLTTAPDDAARLLAALRATATEAIADVRRLVHALRPPALDELGLAGALRRQGEQLGVGGPRITVEVGEPLPTLPAAVEVAAYRIAVEAMTNAVRHAGAGTVRLRVAAGDDLEVDVTDDGALVDSWTPGVGLSSIAERTAELGGEWRAGPADGGGGRVWARLPLEVSHV